MSTTDLPGGSYGAAVSERADGTPVLTIYADDVPDHRLKVEWVSSDRVVNLGDMV
jgi:hypothetical protein